MTVRVRFVGSGDSFGGGGRFQTCILVDGDGTRFAIDFGASSLIALTQQGIEHNSIDAILLTHLHGDHCAGVPFMLVDAMLGAKRSRPLIIAGPRDLRARMRTITDALFPGSDVMVESRFAPEVREELEQRGHQIDLQGDFSNMMGGGQAVMHDARAKVNYGGSDPRKDGAAVPEPIL